MPRAAPAVTSLGKWWPVSIRFMPTQAAGRYQAQPAASIQPLSWPGSCDAQVERARKVAAANENDAWPDGNDVLPPPLGRCRPTASFRIVVSRPVMAKLSAATSSDCAWSPWYQLQPASPADASARPPITRSPDFVLDPVTGWSCCSVSDHASSWV